jgi:hypothetical protein
MYNNLLGFFKIILQKTIVALLFSFMIMATTCSLEGDINSQRVPSTQTNLFL